MNIVITINLNGNAYQLEKSGYDALREYLENAARRLEGNPDKDEIIADIEQAIADKFRAVLGAFKTVVGAKEVQEIIAEMGPVQDPSASADDLPPGAGGQPAPGKSGESTGAAASGEPVGATKRLYKINEGAMLGGVCNGLAAYFNIDVTVIRLLFAILTLFTWGAGALLYGVMVILVPAAHTPAEKAAAFGGAPSTAEEFIRRAKQGYYEGTKTFGDKRAHREWKRRFKREMRGWSRNFRHEMRDNAHQWRQNWHEHWAQHPVPMPGSWLAASVLGLLTVVVVLLGLYSVASLVGTGSVFGLALPVGVPLWVGVVVLLMAFNFVLWPLKAMRYSFHYHRMYGPRYYGPFAHVGHSFAWIGLLILAVWLADRHVPQVHAALEQLRPQVHHAVDSFREWWAAH
jgi:phage shock protein PspC (stress-responsive transcriptional regulator)